MKTNMIRTATFILSMVIVTSVSAQKSLNENSLTSKFGQLVKENINNIQNELKNLRAALQFKPEADYNYSGEIAASEAFDLRELEFAAKYYPSALSESSEAEMSNELNVVLDELKDTVKYQPTNENEDILNEVARELAAVVRYTPAS